MSFNLPFVQEVKIHFSATKLMVITFNWRWKALSSFIKPCLDTWGTLLLLLLMMSIVSTVHILLAESKRRKINFEMTVKKER